MTVTPDQDPAALPVIVIGGGLSGIACARRLHDAGQPVIVWERGHRLGGRMASRTEQLATGPHAVDIGAPYLTVRDQGFGEVVRRWAQFGRAQGWTDTFTLASPRGFTGSTTGPLRWSATSGMRSLVEELASGLDVRLEQQAEKVGQDGQERALDVVVVDGVRARAVVLAMPDPQAARLVTDELAERLQLSARAWVPALAVWAAWPEGWWPDFDAIFVDGSDVLAWVSNDGRSRADDAPVLVAHTTSEFASAHLDDAGSAIGPVLDELPKVIGAGQVPGPLWAKVHRWSLASSKHPHPQPFAVEPAVAGGAALIGVCGDGWGERSRVEQAWLSGDKLGSALLERLAVP